MLPPYLAFLAFLLITTSANGVTLGGRYNYLFLEKWNAYGRLGLFIWSSDIDVTTSDKDLSFDDSGTDIFFGLGIERNLSEQLRHHLVGSVMS